MTRALAKVPKDNGIDLGLGVIQRNGQLRGSLSAAAKINDTVSFVANASAASPSDWAALAGVKVRW